MRESKYEPYLEEYEKSGMSLSDFCSAKGICKSGFHYFYSRRTENTAVTVIRPEPAGEESMTVRIGIGEMTAEAEVRSAHGLGMVLEAMCDVQKRRKA